MIASLFLYEGREGHMTTVQTLQKNPHIEQALRTASIRTGADFDYLLKTAMRESSLKTNAKSKTSSAQGLFQFIDQTWLATLKKSGEAYGLGRVAKAIEARPDGTFSVANPATRSAILALRDDPRISSLMAGAYTRDAAYALQAELGRPPKQGELYIAHFMGKNGAAQLIKHAARTPKATAAQYFPQAAQANKGIFYTADGRPKTVLDVYHNLISKHGSEPVQMAARLDNVTGRAAGLEGDTAPVQFSARQHLSSHFNSGKKTGFLAGLFGGGGPKTAPVKTPALALSNAAMSVMHKQPTQILSPAIAGELATENKKVHVASAPIEAYQKQQAGARVHNLFASPTLRGAFR